jgi:hypothetical protein
VPRDAAVHGAGAAQAIEDRATLAACLSGGGWDVAESLRRYERLRVPRTSRLQAMSMENQSRFHLPDGPEQEERDERMSAGSTDWSFKAVAWIYEHDAALAQRQRTETACVTQASHFRGRLRSPDYSCSATGTGFPRVIDRRGGRGDQRVRTHGRRPVDR